MFERLRGLLRQNSETIELSDNELPLSPEFSQPIVMQADNVTAHYGGFCAVANVDMPIHYQKITTLIGASGCGKSTFLNTLNRMHEQKKGGKISGQVTLRGRNIYEKKVDPIEIRKRVGMVFQKPNPFPKSIFDNVAFGVRLLGIKDKDTLQTIVETSLQRVHLWDEVKDDLKKQATKLSGGQQQRLCIARAIAVEPEVLLMDEPTSALDPISSAAIEELVKELCEEHKQTVVIVTHNMPQAQRVGNFTGFFNAPGNGVPGKLVEFNETDALFTNPQQQVTADYISGKFG